MDPITGMIISSVAPSILGGLFGGGGPDMTAQNAVYSRMISSWDEMDRNYENANLEQADAAQIARYKENIRKKADEYLERYEANRLASGQYGMDSEDTRARAMIANQTAKEVADMEATLDASRLSRYNALIPQAGQLAPAAGLAANIDAGTQAGIAGNNDLLAQLATIGFQMAKGGFKAPSASPAAGPAGIQQPSQALGLPTRTPSWFSTPKFDFSIDL